MSLEKQGNVVAQALKNIATKIPGKSYNELRVIIAIERVVARLEAEPTLAKHLIFKGGFVLLKTMDTARFTRDLDAVAIGLSRERILSLIREALKKDLDDGLWYGEAILEDLKHVLYPGIRFKVPFQIGPPPHSDSGVSKLTQIDIDIAFDTSVQRPLVKHELMPSILTDTQQISWSIYSPEYIFSEKLEALISRGSSSSRAKDIYDLVQIFPKCQSKTSILSAIKTTFSSRNTEIPTNFRDKVASFNLTVLKRSWPNVRKTLGGLEFEQTWISLLEILKKLDND